MLKVSRQKRPGVRKALAVLLAMVFAADVYAEPVAIVADRIIDARSKQLSPHNVIVIEGERIVSLGDRSIIPKGARVHELGDMTLMPGMIDAHAHPLMYGDDYQLAHLSASSAYKAVLATVALQRLLRAGWTSIRVMGDADVFYANQDIKRAIEEGAVVGPRLTGAGHYLSITGGGGDTNFLSPEQRLTADGLIVDGPDEIRKAIRREIKFGSDWIKLLVTGAYQSVGDNPKNVAFSPEELETAVAEARRHGIPVAAHAHATEGIRAAVLAGVRSIEHGTFMSDEVIELMVKHGTFLVPTIYVGDYYTEGQLRADEKQSNYLLNERPIFLSWVGKAHQRGVKIGVGVDLGGYSFPAHVYAREFATLVEAGMTPMEAIQAGTRVNAELLGWDDRLGTLESGKLADIIAVAGNPLDDIAQLEKVSFVMLGGRVITAQTVLMTP